MEKVSYLKKGREVSGFSALISLVLAISKGLIGFLSGSVVLLTSALDSFVDLVGMVTSWFGLKIAEKKPDKKFPYGYYKAESLAAMFVSFFILYAAFELLLAGYSRIFILSEITIPLIALAVMIVSSFASFILSRYLFNAGNQINSQLLITNSKERMIDVFSSLIVFAAILASYYKIPYIEGIVTMGISLLIFKVGLFSIRDSIFALMDVSPSKEIENKIKKILKSIKGVESFENLKLRKAGPFIFGEVIVKIKKFVDVTKAHEIADNIENKIKEQIKQVDSFTVHVEPFKTKRQKILVPVKNKDGLNSEISEHFSRAEYFIFVLMDNKKIKSYYFKANPFKTKKVRTGISVTHYVIKEKIDTVITKEIGEISFHALRDGLVDVYKAEGKRVKDIINNFIDNKLTRLKQQTREKD